MLFSATWRQKSQKIDFMNVFHGFIGFGSETANIFNTCMAQGAYIVQYIVNSCRGCWQYTISIVAGIKNHIFRDPYLLGRQIMVARSDGGGVRNRGCGIHDTE